MAERVFHGHGPDWETGAGVDWRLWCRIIEGVTYVLVGAAYTFGPPWWKTSGNNFYINRLPVPFEFWAILLLAGGVLLLINFWPYNWVTYLFLFITSLFWGLAQLAAVITALGLPPLPVGEDPNMADNPLYHVGGGGPFWLLGIAAFNALFLIVNLKEWRMQRTEKKNA